MQPAAESSSNSSSSSTSCRSSGSISSRMASDCSSGSSASKIGRAPGSISSTMSAIRSSSSFSSSDFCSFGSTSSSVSAATSSSSEVNTASRSAGGRSSRISARSDGCISARRSYSMRSFTRRAGSTSITSTNCHGIPRSLNLRENASSEARGNTPLKTRRKAPRRPTSTSATRNCRLFPCPVHSRSTSFTRTTLRPCISIICRSIRSWAR